MDDTISKPAVDSGKSTVIQVRPQPVQPADRNLVHVTKAQMKGDTPVTFFFLLIELEMHSKNVT